MSEGAMSRGECPTLDQSRPQQRVCGSSVAVISARPNCLSSASTAAVCPASLSVTMATN